jgi:hypothetical protein
MPAPSAAVKRGSPEQSDTALQSVKIMQIIFNIPLPFYIKHIASPLPISSSYFGKLLPSFENYVKSINTPRGRIAGFLNVIVGGT